MQATNGRKGFATLAVGLVSALVLSALGLASSAGAAEPPHKQYLALGDSVAFGYSTEQFNENFPAEEPKKFEEALPRGSGKPNGYVRDYELKLKAEPVINKSMWKAAINDGCPGETSDSMIGNGSLRKQLEEKGFPIAEEEGAWINASLTKEPCAYHYATGYKLHHEYGAKHSQLENALEVIQKENTGDHLKKQPVQLITEAIGANDELRGVGKCQAEVKFEYEHFGDSMYNHSPYYEEKTPHNHGTSPTNAVTGCVKHHVGDIFGHILRNVLTIDAAIFHGGELGLCLNTKSPCDKKHKAVNYSGHLSWLGSYNPYGSVFEETTNACSKSEVPQQGGGPPESTCNHELLEGSNVLQSIYNSDVQEQVESDGGCFANPLPSWNPGSPQGGEMPQFEWGEGEFGSLVSTGHGGKFNGTSLEPDPSPLGTLQKYTNMANFTTATGGNKERNGPGDIHPTPLGYEELAKVISGCPS